MVKQYTVQNAYGSNFRIKKYIDGECVLETIVSDFNLDGYQQAIEDDGFVQAVDAEKAESDLELARGKYEEAVAFYEYAKNNALIKQDEK